MLLRRRAPRFVEAVLVQDSKQAFLASVERQHGRQLRRYLAARLRNAAADAPDLMQEVFLRLLRLEEPRKHPQSRPTSTPSPATSRLKAPRDAELDALIARVISDSNVVLLAPSQPMTHVRHESRSLVRRLAIAASVVLATGTLAWWGLARPESYSTRIGEQRSIALADGSVVQLNSQSQLRVRFSKNERLVELSRGQALFEVVNDASLEGFHIRGTFDANKPERLVTFLSQRFDLSVVETQEEIRLTLKNSSESQ